MLFLILNNINTTTRVGISNLKDAIEQETIHKIINNVVVMIDRMQKTLEEIKVIKIRRRYQGRRQLYCRCR